MRNIYKLLLEVMVFGTTVLLINGVSLSEGSFSFLVGGVLFALAMFAVDPVLGFFKFPRNTWGYLVVGTIFSLLFFVVLNAVVVGIVDFKVATLGGDFGGINLPELSLETEMITVVFTAIFASALSLLMHVLGQKK